MVVDYDFVVEGGGQNTIAIGITSDDATGILVEFAFDGAAFTDTIPHDAIPYGTKNVIAKTTAYRTIIVTIANADLTAG
ncbi:hypothetical protein ACFLZ5_05205 [Thermodesulfobacteriota bacterium]